ncbi:MAG TPA: hypothetical protein VMV81_05085 [Phycisphaerae bacterium]|nr:hypothetical protein [Phycisphaerae bacterium]
MSKRELELSRASVADFEEAVPEVVRRIRIAVSEALVSAGADATRPQSVSRLLGLDKSLTWKVCRLVSDENPLAAVKYMPGKAGLKILKTALSKAGVPADLLIAIEKSTSDFDRITDLHAGDREKLGVMLANVTSEGQRDRAEAQRKLSFRGNSATWGVQAKVQICSTFIAPGTDSQRADMAWISGLVDFWRLRRDVVWAMAAARKTADDGSPLPVGEIHAIDTTYDKPEKVPLLGDFCSQPIADMRIELGRDGLTRYELAEGPVGSAATTTCVIGLYGRNFLPRYQAPNDTLGEHFARLYTPVETLVHDLFVHKDLTYAMTPRIFLYSQMPGGPVFPTAHRDQGMLVVHDPIINLGSGPPDVVTPEFPQYPKMVREVHERMGWRAEDFRGFRFRLRYPPIPSLAVWRYELPAKAKRRASA